MQNRNNKLNEKKRLQKVTRVVSPIIKSRILFTQQAKYNENTKVSSSHNLVVPFIEGNGGRQIKDAVANEKLQGWHTQLLQTFERFLLQLDELFMNLRTEERFKNVSYHPDLYSYKDICEKLRLEVLIAIDKLELTNLTNRVVIEKDIELLDRLGNLKSQLSQIRWEYHQAIQDFSDSKK